MVIKKFSLSFFFVLLMVSRLHAFSSTPSYDTWVPNGPVYTLLSVPGTGTFVGGNFTKVGRYSGNGLLYNIRNSVPENNLANPDLHINGPVYAAIPDGRGGWFVGGSFTNVNGLPVHGLIRLLPDNRLDTTWTPQISDDYFLNRSASLVTTLERYGNRLFVGGLFISPAQMSTHTLIVFDLHEAAPPTQSTSLSISNSVWRLKAYRDTLYISHGNGVSAYDIGSNRLQVLPWDAGISGSSPNLTITPNQQLILGGAITKTVSGTDYHCLIAFDISTSPQNPSFVPWNVNFPVDMDGNRNCNIQSLSSDTHNLYVGGVFTLNTAFATNHQNFAVFSLPTTSSAAASFRSGLPASVSSTNVLSMAIIGSKLYLLGIFSLGPPPQNSTLLTFDIDSAGALTLSTAPAWNPQLDVQEESRFLTFFFTSNDQLLIGGDLLLHSAREASRVYLMNAAGDHVPWNTKITSGSVYALATANNRLFVGGDFSASTFPTTLNHLVAYSLPNLSDNLIGWNSSIVKTDDGANFTGVLSLATLSNNLYVGGNFTVDRDVATQYSDLVDYSLPAEGNPSLLNWNASLGSTTADTSIRALLIDNQTLYAGGVFGNSTSTFENLAALQLTSPGTPTEITTWSSHAEAQVNAIENCGQVLCIGLERAPTSNLKTVTKAGTARAAFTDLAGVGGPDVGTDSFNVLGLTYANSRLIVSGDLNLGAGEDNPCVVDYQTSDTGFVLSNLRISNFKGDACYKALVNGNELFLGSDDVERRTHVPYLFRFSANRVQFISSTATGDESVTSVNIPVVLSAADTSAVSVSYRVLATGTAQSGEDFTLANGTLNFPVNTTSQNISLSITDDTHIEPSETIIVELYNPIGVTLDATTQFTYTITDNDTSGTGGVSGGSGSGGASGNSGVSGSGISGSGGGGVSGTAGNSGISGSGGISGTTGGGSGTGGASGSSDAGEGGASGGSSGTGGGTTAPGASVDSGGCSCQLED